MFWKMPNGMNSDIFARSQTSESTGQFYNIFWRYAHDKTPTFVPPELKERGEEQLGQVPLKNYLVDQAIEMGLPIAQSDSAHTEEHHRLQDEADEVMAENAAILRGEVKPNYDHLDRLTKDRLVEIAAGIGIVNLNVNKRKLIETIIDKQSITKAK